MAGKQKQSVVKLDRVSVSVGEKKLLSNVDWQIKQDENWAMIGPNGSGKTTLLKVIAGYQYFTEGSVKVLGKSLGKTDVRELRRRIGWVSPDLYNRMERYYPVIDVVLSGYFASIGLYETPSAQLKKQALQQLQYMEIVDLADRPFGTLSTGEQKRVLIARALLPRPDLLLLDEVGTNLDLATREKFLPYLQKLTEQKNSPTLILTTHNISEIMPGFNRLMALKKGRVIRQGKKRSVLKSKVLQEVFDTALKVRKRNSRYYIDLTG